MPKAFDALKTTYNAVVTAEVTARDQLALLSDKASPTRKPAAAHVVAFTVYAAEREGNDALEVVHTAKVAVPAHAGDTELAIVRRAVKRFGTLVITSWWGYEATETAPMWWGYDATKATAELADTLAWHVDTLPTVPVYTGLATVADPDGLYEVLHDGDDYEA